MDLKLLKHALWSNWSKETAYLKVNCDWSLKNRSIWQCAVTALVVNKYLGWKIKKWFIPSKNISHYWNEINNEKIDLTYEQFCWEKIVFENVKKSPI